MTQPTSPNQPPFSSQAFRLEFPHPLGTFREYAEVQRLVDQLADAGFPVENTMIVGTDLRLIERVTGRKTWGRVVLSGILSGMWMGLFVGLLLSFFSENALSMIASSVLMGAIFFTVWSVIGHALSGGIRDFTSMTATVPMQYELLVEHRHMSAAREILGTSLPQVAPPVFGAQPTGAAPLGQQPQQSPQVTDEDRPKRPTYGLPADTEQ